MRIGADLTEELGLRTGVICNPGVCATEHTPVGAVSKRVAQAVLPARPIEKGRPGPGLLAHVVTSKYADHLPLYRLEQIFERHGVQVTRRTLSEWNGAVADFTRTHRARHAPGAGAPVVVDSMRRHDAGSTGPDSAA